MFAEILPVLALAPLAGTVVDRFSPVVVLVTADLTRVGLVATLVVVNDHVAAVYVIAFGLSVGGVLFNPAVNSVLPACGCSSVTASGAGQLLAALSAGATSGLLVVLARDHVGVAASGYGLLLVAIGVGAVLGPVVLTRLIHHPRRSLFVFGPYLLRGLVDVVLATNVWLPLTLAALVAYEGGYLHRGGHVQLPAAGAKPRSCARTHLRRVRPCCGSSAAWFPCSKAALPPPASGGPLPAPRQPDTRRPAAAGGRGVPGAPSGEACGARAREFGNGGWRGSTRPGSIRHRTSLRLRPVWPQGCGCRRS